MMYKENMRSHLKRILPDIETLRVCCAVVAETGRKEHYLVEAEKCIDKINDAFRAIENLENEHADDTTAEPLHLGDLFDGSTSA